MVGPYTKYSWDSDSNHIIFYELWLWWPKSDKLKWWCWGNINGARSEVREPHCVAGEWGNSCRNSYKVSPDDYQITCYQRKRRCNVGDLNMILIDFRFSDMAEELHPSGSLVKISLKKRTFQFAPVVPREYLNSRYDLKSILIYSYPGLCN